MSFSYKSGFYSFYCSVWKCCVGFIARYLLFTCMQIYRHVSIKEDLHAAVTWGRLTAEAVCEWRVCDWESVRLWVPRGLVVRQVFLPSGLLRDVVQRWTLTSSTFAALSAPTMKHSRCEQMTLPVPLQLSHQRDFQTPVASLRPVVPGICSFSWNLTLCWGLLFSLSTSRALLMTVIFFRFKWLFNDMMMGQLQLTTVVTVQITLPYLKLK